MSINTDDTVCLLENDVDIGKINNDIIEQNKTLKRINKLTISNLIIVILLLLIIIVMTIEYNIVLHNFNGFGGMETFINKTSKLVNELTTVIDNINSTEVKIYLQDTKFLIDQVCKTMNCN
tara:strand:+ start:799 stop:1161 length:363 start_codon:yes stop_codon:yes gene_type:complete